MNIVKIREKLKLFRKAGIISAKDLSDGLVCPLFVTTHQSAMSDEEMEWTKQNIIPKDGTVPKMIPFPILIIVQNIPGQAKEDNFVDYVFKRRRECDFVSILDGKQLPFVSLMTIIRDVEPFSKDKVEHWVRCELSGKTTGGCTVQLFADGKLHMPTEEDVKRYWTLSGGYDTPRPLKSMYEEIGNTTMMATLRLCFDTMSHTQTTVRVTEQKAGKSVEWHLARSHYLILGSKQAQECQRGKRGPTQHELNRAAHWRRAHLRRLASDKFKHKKGLLVPVRQAWVGPKQWTGLDGKTYMVVDTDNKQ